MMLLPPKSSSQSECRLRLGIVTKPMVDHMTQERQSAFYKILRCGIKMVRSLYFEHNSVWQHPCYLLYQMNFSKT